MADSKVSELTSATTLGSSDVLYLVQSNTSKKITVGTFFANAANTTLKGTTRLDSNVQFLSAPGVIDITKPVTHLESDASGGSISIPAGSTNQIKIIVMVITSGGTYTLTGNILNNDSVVFSSVGNTATLLYTFNKWAVIGGTAAVT